MRCGVIPAIATEIREPARQALAGPWPGSGRSARDEPGKEDQRHGRPNADDAAATVEYLYVPCAGTGRDGHREQTRRWVQEVPIVKKTAKWIYYASDSWNRREAIVSPGRISREQFEADTRSCPR